MSDLPLAIRCRALSKRYGNLVAVDGLDLEVHAGECFGLLGPSGAGKTTAVEILEGLTEPSGGDVEVLGRRWTNDARWLRENIGVSLQETNLAGLLTVRETITLFRSFFVGGNDVESVIDLVALRDKAGARYETLSGGQKQRVAVACALIGRPKLLFLDEPTTGLDPQSRRMLWDVILAFKNGGGTVLLTTHAMDEAERLCDRVGVIDHGKMIALGTPSQLIDTLGGSQIIEVSVEGAADGLLDGLRELPSVRGARLHGGRIVLTVQQVHVALPSILQALQSRRIALTNLSTHRATLEDVFVQLTGRALRE